MTVSLSAFEEKKEDSCNDKILKKETSTPRRTVDRDWLKKLLKKYENLYWSTIANHQRHTDDLQPRDAIALLKGSNDDNILKDKALVVAPMVDHSDLPFRLLCRRYGSNLAYTPMIHAKMFAESARYKEKFFDIVKGTPPEDRPLVAQFCGSSIEHVMYAAKKIEPFVDAIDINCGCPQNIAKRGNYGAYLLEKPDELIALCKGLNDILSIPLCVKVRLLPSGIDDSLRLYERLVNEGGVHLICIHGRNRHQKQQMTGSADWDAIRQAVDLLGDKIPIMANGSISDLSDCIDCIKLTKVDGIMSSEALLEYPPLFLTMSSKEPRTDGLPGRLQITREYIALAKQFPPHQGGQGSKLKCIKSHTNKFLYTDLQANADIRTMVVSAKSINEIEAALAALQQRYDEINHSVEDERLGWYFRHRKNSSANNGGNDIVNNTCYSTNADENKDDTLPTNQTEVDEDIDCYDCVFAGNKEDADGDY